MQTMFLSLWARDNGVAGQNVRLLIIEKLGVMETYLCRATFPQIWGAHLHLLFHSHPYYCTAGKPQVSKLIGFGISAVLSATSINGHGESFTDRNLCLLSLYLQSQQCGWHPGNGGWIGNEWMLFWLPWIATILLSFSSPGLRVFWSNPPRVVVSKASIGVGNQWNFQEEWEETVKPGTSVCEDTLYDSSPVFYHPTTKGAHNSLCIRMLSYTY